MRKLPFIFLFLTIFTSSLYSQHERPVCPAWKIVGRDGTVKPGELVTFTAQIDTFGRLYKLEYRWLAEAGLTPGKGKAVEILSGQGTPMITVVQPEGGTTVGLEIRGFPRDCIQVAYESALVAVLSGPRNDQPGDCPKISISGPSGILNPGDPIPFTAQVDTGGKELKLEYVWSVSAGEIISGQGTSAISVKVPGDSITATVEIRGFPEGCPKTMSETGHWDLPPQAGLIESFRGPITIKDKARFDKINKVMLDDPNTRYLFFVAGKDIRRLGANKQMILKYLSPGENVRITFVDLPANTEVTQFWRVPDGADFPSIGGTLLKP